MGMMTFMFHNKVQRHENRVSILTVPLLPAEAFIINLLRGRLLLAQHGHIYWSIIELDKSFSKLEFVLRLDFL